MSRRDARSLWLSQNLFDDLQFPLHTVTASSSPVGNESWRVATGRRSAIDAWAPPTQNSTQWIAVDCATPRPANLLVIDRGHNLGVGGAFSLEGRSSTAQPWTAVVESTAVATVVGPAPSTAAWGAPTYEGALVREFRPAVFRHWRLRVPPSTGYAPVIRNMALGQAWIPSEPAVGPSDWDATQVNYDETVTPSGWRGTGRVALTREGAAMYRLTSFGEYETSRRHMQEYQQGRISWYVPQRGRAELAMCVQIPAVRMPAPQEPGNIFRTLSLPYREHQPLPL